MIKTLFQRKVMEEQNIFIQTMSRQGRESKFNIHGKTKLFYLKMTEYIYHFPPNHHTTSGWRCINSCIFISALWCLCPGGEDWWVRGWATGHWAGQGITDYARARPSRTPATARMLWLPEIKGKIGWLFNTGTPVGRGWLYFHDRKHNMPA